MRVVFPHTSPHPFALAALEEFAPGAERELIDPYRPEQYYELLAGWWGDGETFLIVEQDIEIHADVIPQLEVCDGDWCIFPYGGPGYGKNHGDGADHLLKRSLGCTRFSERLLKTLPSFMGDLPVRNWQRLDCEINPKLVRAGFTPCLHEPNVAHHHVYDGLCACGKEHPCSGS